MNIANTNQTTDTQALNRIFYNYALKSAQNFKNESQAQNNDTKEDDIRLIGQNDIFEGVNIEEIKQTAQSIGEEITDDDIKYALTYGRSVLADYSA